MAETDGLKSQSQASAAFNVIASCNRYEKLYWLLFFSLLLVRISDFNIKIMRDGNKENLNIC